MKFKTIERIKIFFKINIKLLVILNNFKEKNISIIKFDSERYQNIFFPSLLIKSKYFKKTKQIYFSMSLDNSFKKSDNSDIDDPFNNPPSEDEKNEEEKNFCNLAEEKTKNDLEEKKEEIILAKDQKKISFINGYF